MKYKALSLDLDGTTIPNEYNALPSPGVTRAIAEAKKLIYVCIATGRPLYKTIEILNHLDLSGPCILDQGAQIYDPVAKKMLLEYQIDPHLIPRILPLLYTLKVPVFVFDGQKDMRIEGAYNPDHAVGLYVEDAPHKLVDSIMPDLACIPGIAVHKMHPWHGTGVSLEVTHQSATKLHGVVEVSRILGVAKEEIIGVGDGYNDFPLLMASGLKIAMGNAVNELKAIADFVAPTVDEDGVATIINTFVLH